MSYDDNTKIEYTKLRIQKVIKVTLKSVLVDLRHMDIEPLWIPRSCLNYASDKLVDKTTDIGELMVASWWLKKEGI